MFKSLFLGLALMFAVSAANAEVTSLTPDQCRSIEGFARAAMVYRQGGGSISTMMEIVDGPIYDSTISEKQIEVERKLMRAIVLSAFEIPRQDTNTGRIRAIEDFAEVWGGTCWKKVVS